MRFFHISDLHLGLKLRGYSLLEEQRDILDKIINSACEESVDGIVIAGDIYDRSVPPAEAVELFDYFISELTTKVPEIYIMVISGNHDSPERLNIFRNILNKDRIYMIGMPPTKEDETIEVVKINDKYGVCNFYLLPYVVPHMVKKVLNIGRNENISYNEAVHKLILREDIDTTQRNILVSHQFYNVIGRSPDSIERADSENVTVGNIDEVKSDILETFDYAALGHIHKPSIVGGENYRYSGSPMCYSVSEAGQEKSIVCIDMCEKGTVDIKLIPIKEGRNVINLSGSIEEVLEKASDDYVEVTVFDIDKSNMTKMDAKNAIRDAFPHLLNIRWRQRIEDKDRSDVNIDNRVIDKNIDPFELCKMFLGDIDKEDEKILRDTINEIREQI